MSEGDKCCRRKGKVGWGKKDQECVGGGSHIEKVRWEQTPALNEGVGQAALQGKGAPSSGHC